MGNRAAHAALDWAQRGANDSGEKNRVTCASRREKTLPRYVCKTPRKNTANFEVVCRFCLPGDPGPPSGQNVSAAVGQEGLRTSPKEHNDYKAKMRVCVSVCARVNVCL